MVFKIGDRNCATITDYVDKTVHRNGDQLIPKKSRKKCEKSDDQALFKALSHPIRVKVLESIGDGHASPKEIAEELEIPLSNVSYHVRVLADLDYLQLVSKHQVRGSMQHFYCMKPDSFKGGGLQQVLKGKGNGSTTVASASLMRKLVGSPPSGLSEAEANAASISVVVDDEGLLAIGSVLRDTLAKALAVQEESQTRLSRKGGERITRTVAVASLKPSELVEP